MSKQCDGLLFIPAFSRLFSAAVLRGGKSLSFFGSLLKLWASTTWPYSSNKNLLYCNWDAILLISWDFLKVQNILGGWSPPTAAMTQIYNGGSSDEWGSTAVSLNTQTLEIIVLQFLQVRQNVLLWLLALVVIFTSMACRKDLMVMIYICLPPVFWSFLTAMTFY